MEIWGGVECTLNRVGNQYYSQCEKNGHQFRPEDIELFAHLKIKKVRYPCLWENMSAQENVYDWTWPDTRLPLLQQHGLDPIVGLLHHGSGPKFTHLLHPSFAEQFAEYAGKFAERFPWVTHYIPVDEILTTARFSCLYGHWYPHKRDDRSFVRAVFNQVKATILAMKAIRKSQPSAKLVQAEDLGRAQSTDVLAYQCQFENHRRWLAFDMLCGRIDSQHPLYRYLHDNGLTEDDVLWLTENRTPPDILGLNHYVLSNRFLDHRIEDYPEHCRGGNGIHRYADVSSADTDAAEFISPGKIFLEAWERYGIPLAITEVHIRGHREDQMRWLHHVWRDCKALEESGVDIRALTAWSLLGSYDWNILCTRNDGFYEPGVFDLRTPQQKPKATALALMIQRIQQQNFEPHPVLSEPGWWEAHRNLLYSKNISAPPAVQKTRPIVITGGKGKLAQAFARICERRHLHYILLGREDLDIADEVMVKARLDGLRPWAVINAAGYVHVDLAESNPLLCFRENVLGAKNLAAYCDENKIRFVTYSSDFVFDGRNEGAYLESDAVAPVNTYGRSKVECEKQVLAIAANSLVVRTSTFFSPWDQACFVGKMIRQLRRKEELHVVSDIRFSTTYLPDLVHASLDLILDEERGIVHLANQGGRSWSEIAKELVYVASRHHHHHLDQSLIVEKPSSSFPLIARRPANSVLGSERVQLLSDFESAMDRYFRDSQF